MKKTFKSLMIAALGLSALASAQMPTSVLFQGMLTKSGVAVSSNNELLLLKICTAKTGDNCTTVFDGSVVVSNGYYSALMSGLPAMDKPYWIEVVANNTIASERIPLTASPYALRADVADSVAAGAAVRSLNGLSDNVSLAVGGSNSISKDEKTNTITIQGPNLGALTTAVQTSGSVTSGGALTVAGTTMLKGGLLTQGQLSGYGFAGKKDYRRILSYSVDGVAWDGGLIHGLYSGRNGSCLFNIQIGTNGTAILGINTASKESFHSFGGLYYFITADNKLEVWVAMSASDDYGRLQELSIPFGSVDFTLSTSASLPATWTAIP